VEHAELAIEFGFCMRATQSNTSEPRVQPQVSLSTCDASAERRANRIYYWRHLTSKIRHAPRAFAI